MNKKSLIIIPIFLLMLIVSVYFVNGFGFISRQPPTPSRFLVTNTSTLNDQVLNLTGGHGGNFSYTELVNWTRGGKLELYNFTIPMY